MFLSHCPLILLYRAPFCSHDSESRDRLIKGSLLFLAVSQSKETYCFRASDSLKTKGYQGKVGSYFRL